MRKILSMFMVTLLTLTLFIGDVSYAEGDTTITIIHTNDVHGRAEGDDKSLIGYAKLKTYVDNQKKTNPNTILVDAGDTIHGTTFANISEGKTMVDLMDRLGYLLSVPGNHDFNYGYDKLVEISKGAKFEYLAANVVRKDGKKDLKDNFIHEIDGVKIGFFGLATPETRFKSSPKNTKNVDFLDYIKTSKEQVTQLKENGADIIIAVVHLGLDKSSVERSDILAENVDGIDLIIDGHSHTELENGKKIGDTLIVQAGEYLKNIGVVNITYDGENTKDINAKLVKFDEVKDLQADEEILNLIQKANEENEKLLGRVVGKTDVTLDGERKDVRTKQTNLSNLITDAMRESVGADIALTNGGGIRATIPQGEITMGDILTTLPFTNFVVGIEVTGSDIKSALEHGLDSFPEPAGKFPQVSGMTVKYDSSKAGGDRVVSILVGDEEIDMNKTYKLATNDFMAIGGDDYKMFEGKVKYAENALLSDVLAEKIIALPNQTFNQQVDMRIEDIKGKIEQISQPTPPAKDVEAVVSSHKIKLNGEYVDIGAYAIDGNNYFMLRDIAKILKDTKNAFDVSYDAKQKAMVITTGQNYSGDIKLMELQKPKSVSPTNNKLFVDGKENTSIKAFLVDGNNYFRLVDLSKTIGFDVQWDEENKTVVITTSAQEDKAA